MFFIHMGPVQLIGITGFPSLCRLIVLHTHGPCLAYRNYRLSVFMPFNCSSYTRALFSCLAYRNYRLSVFMPFNCSSYTWALFSLQKSLNLFKAQYTHTHTHARACNLQKEKGGGGGGGGEKKKKKNHKTLGCKHSPTH